jgi:hypothetical protein
MLPGNGRGVDHGVAVERSVAPLVDANHGRARVGQRADLEAGDAAHVGHHRAGAEGADGGGDARHAWRIERRDAANVTRLRVEETGGRLCVDPHDRVEATRP